LQSEIVSFKTDKRLYRRTLYRALSFASDSASAVCCATVHHNVGYVALAVVVILTGFWHSLCICLFVTTVCPAKMAEAIEIPYDLVSKCFGAVGWAAGRASSL